MKAGFCSVDITPPVGITMGGNMRDDSRARGVHDPLFADILILERDNCTVALIDLDWVAAELAIISMIKRSIVRETSLIYESICISMSHTHSGPDVYPVLNRFILSDDLLEYIDSVTNRIIAGVKRACKDMTEVLTGWGKGFEDKISFNRRVIMKDGSLMMNWNFIGENPASLEVADHFEGAVDTEIKVLKICHGNKLVGTIINFALHPAVLVGKDFLFSKDFIWGLEEELRKICGDDLFIYFANGAQGNINHINIHDPKQGRDWDEAYRIGEILARDVAGILDKTDVGTSQDLDLVYRKIEVPRRKILPEDLEQARRVWQESRGVYPSLLDGIADEWYAGDLLLMSGQGIKSESVELMTIRIGEGVIATLPGEVFAEYGLQLKQHSPFPHTILFGITNQSVGYIPTPEAIIKGGLEARTCRFSSLAPEAGDRIIQELEDMIRELAEANNPDFIGT